MAFIEHVIEVRNELDGLDDLRLETLIQLTEPRPYLSENEDGKLYDLSDYERLWKSLYIAEKRRIKAGKIQFEELTNKWVYEYLDAVIIAKSSPKYVQLNNANRNILISELRSATTKLKKIYTENKCDEVIIKDDGLFSYGFEAYDEDSEGNLMVSDQSKQAKVSINDVLDFFCNMLIDDIDLTEGFEKEGDQVALRVFEKYLVRRNNRRYGIGLHETVSITMWGIFGQYRRPSTIFNSLKRLNS